jgi:hypothetical protein
MPLGELAALARKEGYDEDGAADRESLSEFLTEIFEDRAREKEQENSPSVQVEESKYQITDSGCIECGKGDSFPIAVRYNQTKITLMVRDPHWAFAYWDIDDKIREKLPAKEDGRCLVLRVKETDSVPPVSFDIPIQLDDSSWYIYLPHQDCGYVLELGIVSQERFGVLAASNPIRTPREDLSVSGGPVLDLLSDYNAYVGIGGSSPIPQRILAAGGE